MYRSLFKKLNSKIFLLSTGVGVFALFTAAYNDVDQRGYHTNDEIGQFKVLLQGDLPTGSSDMFMGSGRCAGCHGIDNDIENLPLANVNALGENVSPAENWRATMMANSAKDPMWRAKVAHEVSINPAHANELVNKCTSCHAPLGRYEAVHDGIENYTMEMLDADSLALDGVSCMACHAQQIEPTGNFFSGELHYNPDSIWGPIFNIPKGEEPMADYIMQNFVGVTPVAHEKASRSETCAGCHTLLTNTADLDGDLTGTQFVEQATYHEWLNSSYNSDDDNAVECQGCHMPRLDEPIIVASGYGFLPGRMPYGQHWLVGGNTFMLGLMKNHIAELGITATENHFDMVIQRTLDNLQNHSAEIEVLPGVIDGDTARYTVKITNKAGHKLPSGYPARRAYIEFVMTDESGVEIFHSGKLTPGFEVQGQNADLEPHYDIISDDFNEVQIYELVMGDVMGNVTTVLERADHPLKDNRLVPSGFSTEHAAYDTISIVGSALIDPNFNVVNGNEGSGTDEVHYHVPVNGVNGNVTVTARLMYQSLPPKWNEELFSVDHPVINAFEEMYWAEGPDPVMMVETQVNSNLVGMNESNSLFTIGPNPTMNGLVNIDGGKNVLERISIFSSEGKLIETIIPNNPRTNIKLPVISGTYLLYIETSAGSKIEKVMRK